jgi:hypothetical protein
MKRKNMIRLLALVLVAAATSCTTQQQTEPSSQPSLSRVAITSFSQVTYTSADPVELKATFGAHPTFIVTIRGGAGKERWTATAMLTSAQARDARATLHVSDAPIGEEVANLTHTLSEGTRERASTGVLNFAVNRGQISGTANTAPVELGAIVLGDSSVSCWVPRSWLGAAQGGSTQQGTRSAAGGDDEALVEDVDLASPQCGALRAWRRS